MRNYSRHKITKYLNYLVALILIIPVFPLHASSRDENLSNVPLRKILFNNDRLMVLGLILARSTEEHVIEDLGKTYGKTWKNNDDKMHESEQLCYVGSDGTTIAFEYKFAWDETSNGNDYGALPIGTIYVLEKKSESEIVTRCLESSKINRDISFVNGVRLGMRPSQVFKIWGKPQKMLPNGWVYHMENVDDESGRDFLTFYFQFHNQKLFFAKLQRYTEYTTYEIRQKGRRR